VAVLQKTIFFLIASLVVSGQESTDFAFIGVNGPTSIHRGSAATKSFEFYWLRGGVASIDTERDVVTCTGCNLALNQNVFFHSPDGTVPTAFLTPGGYLVRRVKGDAFQLNSSAHGCSETDMTSACLDFFDAGAGTVKIGQRVSHNHIVFTGITGLPEGVTATLSYAGGRALHTMRDGKEYNYGAYSPTWISFTVSPTAATGPATVRVNFEVAGSSIKYVDIPIEIKEVVPVSKQRPRNVPPIPNLDRVEQTLKGGALRWCDPNDPYHDKYVFNVSGEFQAWYYDGGAIYHEIADYFNEPQWRACADNMLKQYRDYINGPNPDRWKLFADGLLRHYEYTGDPSYLAAIRRMESLATTGQVSDDWIREISFSLEFLTVISKVDKKKHPALEGLANNLLGILDQLYVSKNARIHQTFMDGLALRALIRYYEFTVADGKADERIPVMIKTGLDWLWEHWNIEKRMLMYNPNPKGKHCDYGCQELEGTSHLLAAPAFAWYWKHSGNEDYQIRGDHWFGSLATSFTFNVDTESDRILAPKHGLYAYERVRLVNGVDASRMPGGTAASVLRGGLPEGLQQVTDYWVRNPDENSFQVSVEWDGPVQDITSGLTGRAPLALYVWDRDVSDKAKSWNQQMRWIFDYIRWRSLRD
jgi:hypothetical protein